MKINTGTDEVHVRVEKTAGPLDAGYTALMWLGENANNTINVIEGSVGVAVLAGQDATVSEIVQRGGVLRVGNGATGTVTVGSFDKTGGEHYFDNVIVNGSVIVRG